MDEAWKQLPRAAVIVCASVLGPGSARAQEPEADTQPDASAQLEEPPGPIAPTCGAGCHDGAYDKIPAPPPPTPDMAPTCGSACHGGGGDETYSDVAPPPVEPAKKGCAVEDADDHSPIGLAALGMGLLAGVAGRRRREDESSS